MAFLLILQLIFGLPSLLLFSSLSMLANQSNAFQLWQSLLIFSCGNSKPLPTPFLSILLLNQAEQPLPLFHTLRLIPCLLPEHVQLFPLFYALLKTYPALPLLTQALFFLIP